MNDSSPETHWLWRLSAASWLQAAQHEWVQGQQRLQQRRTCVTHLRRAAGMSLNAVLVHSKTQPDLRAGFDPETHWGRSYMEHLAQAAVDPYPLRENMGAVILRLKEVSLHSPAPALVALRTGAPLVLAHALNDAQEILDACAEYCQDALEH